MAFSRSQILSSPRMSAESWTLAAEIAKHLFAPDKLSVKIVENQPPPRSLLRLLCTTTNVLCSFWAQPEIIHKIQHESGCGFTLPAGLVSGTLSYFCVHVGQRSLSVAVLRVTTGASGRGYLCLGDHQDLHTADALRLCAGQCALNGRFRVRAQTSSGRQRIADVV